MNFELAQIAIAAVGLLVTILLNWEKVKQAPRWLIAFVIGLCSGFLLGFLV